MSLLGGKNSMSIDGKNLGFIQRRFNRFRDRGFCNHYFKIHKPCRVDNGLIVPSEYIKKTPCSNSLAGIASFIPAAGASTRFISSLQDIYDKSRGSKTSYLKDLSGKPWLLPQKAKDISLQGLKEIISTPKALFPCVKENYSFLDLKCLEQKALGLEKLIFVTPEEKSKIFFDSAKTHFSDEKEVNCYEQGLNLKTFRLSSAGQPILESGGQLSLVSAGHGALLELLPLVSRDNPNIDTIFVRNIDNILGVGEEAINCSKKFLNYYRVFHVNMGCIRKSINNRNYEVAASFAEELLSLLPERELSDRESVFLDSFDNKYLSLLWKLILRGFNTPIELCLSFDNNIKGIEELYSRPINILGQVPNNGKDVGGTPVFARVGVYDVTLCIEANHIKNSIRKDFFEGEQKATHFNPVFLASELPKTIDSYLFDGHPYWMFATKRWRGEAIYYCETLLYELLGNSLTSNLVFVELPRVVFNPHKTLDDTANSSFTKWS